ncbi:MAG: hypothetical protein KGH63_00390, partial [Candidatus Micrarchaeota archaeon]|nr:hypothetical protein [Candidatus Micrarchaeota archaeon]
MADQPNASRGPAQRQKQGNEGPNAHLRKPTDDEVLVKFVVNRNVIWSKFVKVDELTTLDRVFGQLGFIEMAYMQKGGKPVPLVKVPGYGANVEFGEEDARGNIHVPVKSGLMPHPGQINGLRGK